MTNREQAKMTLYGGVENFLTETDAVYAGDTPFTTEKGKFLQAKQANSEAAAESGTDNSGYSAAKALAKENMAIKISYFAGKAQVKWEDDGLLELAGQMLIAKTDYTEPADAEAGSMATAAVELMEDNIGTLTGYIAAGDITLATGLIATFTNTTGSSDAAHQGETADTAAFKSTFPPADKSIKRLRSLGRFAIGTPDENWYNELIAVTRMPAVNVHHTVVNVTVKKRENNEPIEGVTGKLSVSDKTGTSNLNGVLQIAQVRSGKEVTLTLTAPGRKTLQMLVAIERGRDNNFEVSMEVE